MKYIFAECNLFRTLKVQLNALCYRVLDDTDNLHGLSGLECESFEQLLSAVMGTVEFSNHLLKLVADKLR